MAVAYFIVGVGYFIVAVAYFIVVVAYSLYLSQRSRLASAHRHRVALTFFTVVYFRGVQACFAGFLDEKVSKKSRLSIISRPATSKWVLGHRLSYFDRLSTGSSR